MERDKGRVRVRKHRRIAIVIDNGSYCLSCLSLVFKIKSWWCIYPPAVCYDFIFWIVICIEHYCNPSSFALSVSLVVILAIRDKRFYYKLL